jgi:hypothetical protein
MPSRTIFLPRALLSGSRSASLRLGWMLIWRFIIAEANFLIKSDKSKTTFDGLSFNSIAFLKRSFIIFANDL